MKGSEEGERGMCLLEGELRFLSRWSVCQRRVQRYEQARGQREQEDSRLLDQRLDRLQYIKVSTEDALMK